MDRIVDATAPVAEFALRETFRAVPEAEIEILRAAGAGGASAPTTLRATGSDPRDLWRAMRADETIETTQPLVDSEAGGVLLDVEGAPDETLPAETARRRDATLLSAYGTDDTWHLRLLVPDPEAAEVAGHSPDRNDGLLTVRSVRPVAEAFERTNYGLGGAQRETLCRTRAAGYFDVPRDRSLSDLADEFDVTHQALSERIRRALGTLVENTVATPHPRQSP